MYKLYKKIQNEWRILYYLLSVFSMAVLHYPSISYNFKVIISQSHEMLCRKFRQIFYNKSNWNNNLQHFLISTRLSKKCVTIDGFWALNRGDIRGMSTMRFVLKDLSIMRLWSACRRSYFVSTVVRRCRRDRGVRDVIQRFRHAFLRPRQTLLLSATAAYKSHTEETEVPPNEEKNITDEELQALLKELENVSTLSRNTLFCSCCGRRLVIDKKLSGVTYCSCKESKPAEDMSEGWVPYMEAEDVIVWRKQYKPGQPYYAYKVYGRYKELSAQDFAAVQVDGAYRRIWDAAVVSLSVVERRANGVDDQTVLHWEVLWPRLFANRDYVYIRRHKEFDVERSAPAPPVADIQRPSVHSNAKRKAMEDAQKDERVIEVDSGALSNKVYIIASRSCSHDAVPESKHAIRVADFWSHMVIKTLEGPEKPGMEFVLTYYEEPAVGGLPSGVATWATGRAAPAFLERQRRAAAEYRSWRATITHQDLPDYIPFGPETEATLDSDSKNAISEQDMESSKHGPDMDSAELRTQDQSTQTDNEQRTSMIARVEAQDAGSEHQATEQTVTEATTDDSKKDETEPAQEPKTHKIVIERVDAIHDEEQLRDTPKQTTKGEEEIKRKEAQTVKDTKEHGDHDNKDGVRGNKDGVQEKKDGVHENKDGVQEKKDGGRQKQDGDGKENGEEEDNNTKGSWWRYLYPFYYFA